ncbi:Outer membrane scaffolding protein for murein synthesis, MipA/OmpV family [Paraburkholderia tropica]|uniref:MipA/OmpV family protein n=1 Tax=Paraburkholderia tropica TaxID=92647 RepID=UPI001CB2A889|nr:MipA/OmpV family protein [Paraburkholderia tropica]CAG9228463.1 Outer membrane scaffolding protein for murein synthesis, MipA/OmpV family [Paraburkholderia tropica]
MYFLRRPANVGRFFVLTASLASNTAFAQSSTTPAALASTNTSVPDDGWRYSLGFGVFETPKYQGASATRFQPAPIVGAAYGRMFFGSIADTSVPFGVGAFLYRDDYFRLGVALSYDLVSPRDTSDDFRLHGLPDINRTAHATLFGNYSRDWFSLVGAVSQDIAAENEGTTASLDLLTHYHPSSRWTLSVGPGITWGSAQYNRTFFGVDSEGNARSGLPVYTPGAGIAAFRLTAGASYILSRHWSLGARVVATRLPGTVGNSPIVERKAQMTYGTFAGYAF